MSFFIRDAYQSFKSKVQRGTFAGQDIEIPVSRTAGKFISGSASFMRGMTEENKVKREKELLRGLDELTEATLSVGGIPYSTPKNIIRGFMTPPEPTGKVKLRKLELKKLELKKLKLRKLK